MRITIIDVLLHLFYVSQEQNDISDCYCNNDNEETICISEQKVCEMLYCRKQYDEADLKEMEKLDNKFKGEK